jgi:hypothetical protein
LTEIPDLQLRSQCSHPESARDQFPEKTIEDTPHFVIVFLAAAAAD